MIRDEVQEVFDAFVACLPDEISTLVKEKTFIAGGCFKSLVLGEIVNDYDFFFVDDASRDKFDNYIRKIGGTVKPTPFTNHKAFQLSGSCHFSQNAITFKKFTKKVQVITKFTGSPKTIVGGFDFKHCMSYLYPANKEFELNRPAILSKELEFNLESTRPVGAMKRMVKFIQQGWSITDREYMNIAQAINKLKLNTPQAVKEHGVTSDDGY